MACLASRIPKNRERGKARFVPVFFEQGSTKLNWPLIMALISATAFRERLLRLSKQPAQKR